MPYPDQSPIETELTHSQRLRDKVFEWLPPRARGPFLHVEVKLFPIDPEGEIRIALDADGVLDLEVKEWVYTPIRDGQDTSISGAIVKGVELDADTGAVHAYTETARDGMKDRPDSPDLPIHDTIDDPTNPYAVDGKVHRPNDITAAQADVEVFTASKEQFFLRAFDSL